MEHDEWFGEEPPTPGWELFWLVLTVALLVGAATLMGWLAWTLAGWLL